MQRLFMISKRHKKVFGSNDPVTMDILIRTIFDTQDEKIGSFEHYFHNLTPKSRKTFWKLFIEEIPIKGLHQIATSEGMKAYGDKHEKLIKDIDKAGIKIPLLVIEDATIKGGPRSVIEGHHRAGAAKILGIETVPAFIIGMVGFTD